MEVAYRQSLRILLGLDKATRNEVLYIVAGRPALGVLFMKQMWRFHAGVLSSD